jgi:hypothetical protein
MSSIPSIIGRAKEEGTGEGNYDKSTLCPCMKIE